jgi:tRNA1(Val) A37 N6-methylase TrmN6
VALRPVHPRADAPASRILAYAKKGTRGPLSVAPALVLHQPSGTFTARAEAIHRGEEELPF